MQIIPTIQKQIKEKKLPQSLILEGKEQNFLVQTSQEIVRLLFCPNQSYPNDHCEYCQKQNWLDVISIGDGATEIGKEEIQTMMHQMRLSALENHGKKVYIIQNAEKLKVIAANALLKFLEEPPHDTYAILLTTNRGQILPTIKSRCQNYRLENQNQETQLNQFESLLRTKDKNRFFLASLEFKDVEMETLIKMIEQSLTNTLWPLFPFWVEPTLELLTDLKSQINSRLALENYFITIARGCDENS